MTELEEGLLKAIDKFKTKLEQKPEYMEELAGWNKNIVIDAGEEKYHFTIDDTEVKNFGPGSIDPADICVVAETDILLGMLDGSISPMKAFAKKQLKIKASMTDLLKIRNFF